MRAIASLLNRYRAELLPMLLLALVVAVTAFLAAVSPRLFNRVADEGLRHDVERAESAERNLELGQIGALSGGSGLGPVADMARRLEAELPDSVRGLIAGRSYYAESANWTIHEPPTEQPSWLRFRLPDGVDDRITYVEGRPPTGDTTTIPGRRGTLPGEPEDATVFEVALSTTIAETLGVGLGDRLELIPDTEDVLVGQFSSPARAAADVVGLYTVDDRDDEFWMNDTSLELPTVIIVSPSLRLLYGTALLSADAYPALMSKGLPARYAWRQYIDPSRLDAGMLDTLTADLRQMQTQYPPFVTTLRDADVTTLRTSLLDLLDGFAAERRTAEAVLVTAALGPAAVATAAVALVALLMVHRRRRAVTLVRGRGASLGQLLGSHLLEGLLIATPAAAAAYLAAVLVVGGRPTPMSPLLATIVAGAAAGVLVLTVLRVAAAPIRDVEREAASATRLSPRRLVFEVLVIVLAAGGAFLLRQRGLAGGSTAGQLGGVDPLLAAVPALIGLAVGLLTIRLYPLPLRLAGWFADGWRGMVPAFGLRRAARTGDVGSLPLVVLLVTVAIGAFSSTIFVTVEHGQSAAAWHEVGADMAITPGTRPFPADFDAATLPGVEAAARMHIDAAALGGRGGVRVTMHALDTPAYASVTAGTGADARLPGPLRDPPSADQPVPAIVSSAVATNGPRPIRRGDEVEMVVSGRTVLLRVVDVREAFPGIDAAGPWLVVPLESLRSAIGDRAFTASVIFLRAPGAGAAEVQAAMDEVLPATRVISRQEVLDELRTGPLVRGVAIGFVLAVAIALVYAALAVTAALILVAAVRSRETAHLRTLGLTPRGLLALSVVEHGPAVLTATLIGVALGVGVAWFIAPGLDLAGLIGSPIEVALVVDGWVVGLLLVALVVVLAIGIVLSTWIGRRVSLAGATRQGIE
ncbi:MAG TPA: FtsX-like permease family protein [Candidatus Limnocylindria bacterium]